MGFSHWKAKMGWLCGAWQMQKRFILKFQAGTDLCLSWDKAPEHVGVWEYRVQSNSYSDLLQLGRIIWKGLSSSFLFYGKQDTKFPGKKAQIYQNAVKYLSFHLSQGQHGLGPERKQAVCSIPAPKTCWQIREFLGAAGFCRIWIPNYSLLSTPIYEATKGGEWEPYVMGEEQDKAFREIKRALTNAPALGLPDVMKPFFLYVHE
jgi:hypothetical protein